MKFKKAMITVAALSMLVGCGTSKTSRGPIEEGDTIKIGFIGPLTGEVSSYGIPIKNTIEMAINDYNKSADAKYKFELLAEDTGGSEAQATNAYKKLYGQGVAGIVGPVITAEGLAVGEASKNDLLPIVSSSTSGDTITLTQDGSTRANYFRTCSNDSMGGKTIAAAIADGTINVKKVAVLTQTGSDYSEGCTKSFLDQATADNIQVVYKESYPSTQKEFGSYIKQIMASGADAVFIPDYYETIATIVKQFKDEGFTGTFLGTDGWDGVLSIEGVDKNMFNGAYYTNTFDDRELAVTNYAQRYKKLYNSETNMFGTMAYDATMIMIKAIEAAQSTDSAKINEALEKTSYDGITGHFEFDAQHNPTKLLLVKTIKDGQYGYLD